jgi:putative ABC transport system permease protein
MDMVVTGLWLDVRRALRDLIRHPGFSAGILVSLSLGIGAATAIFTVMNAVVLRPLAYDRPERLVVIGEIEARKDDRLQPVSPANFADWRKQAQSFEDVAATIPWNFILTGSDEPEQITGARVSQRLFPLLGIQPILGRTFLAEEDRFGAKPAVLLSEGLWRRRFGGRADALGQTMLLNGQYHQIVGVLPFFPQFFARQAELWVPVAFAPQELSNRGFGYVSVVGRLRAGATLSRAAAEMQPIAQRLAEAYPETNAGRSVKLVALHDYVVGDFHVVLLILSGAVALVLLSGCANAASLMLVHVTSLRRESAIYLAIGAGRWNVVRKLLMESLLLSAVSAVLGVLLAYGACRALVAFGAVDIPRLKEIGLDMRVVGFTAGLSVLIGLVFGVVPALRASRPDLVVLLKGGKGGSFTRWRWNSARNWLVVAEVSVAMMLLVGASLLIESFQRLQNVNPGFRSDHLLSMRIALPKTRYGQPWQQTAFYDRMLERVSSVPGIQSAGTVTSLPFSGNSITVKFRILSGAVPAAGENFEAGYSATSPGYFRTMGIPTVKGRFFTEQDKAEQPPVAVINEMMAQRYWPNEDPLGKKILLQPTAALSSGAPAPREIIGIVGNVKHTSLAAQPRAEVYVPYAQFPMLFTTLAVRTIQDPLAMSPAVQREIRTIDRDQPVFRVITLDQLIATSVAQPRLRSWLIAVFALVTLVLAAAGLYSLIAYSVQQRIREIGIRMALGATRGDVLRLVIAERAAVVAAGLLLGSAGALACTRMLSGFLFDVHPADPLTFVRVVVFLAAVALAAGYIPARRAAQIQPSSALRHE